MTKSTKTTGKTAEKPEPDVPDVVDPAPADKDVADPKPDDQSEIEPVADAQTEEEAKIAAEEAAKAPKEYIVAEGVAWVNGKKVPADRQVFLTDAEAAFDKGLGRIKPAAPPTGEDDGKNPEPPAE